MRATSWGLGVVLAVLPVLAMLAAAVGLLRLDGSHGLGTWFFLSLCGAAAGAAAVYNLVLLVLLLRRGEGGYPLVWTTAAWVFAAITAGLFLWRYGLPFAR